MNYETLFLLKIEASRVPFTFTYVKMGGYVLDSSIYFLFPFSFVRGNIVVSWKKKKGALIFILGQNWVKDCLIIDESEILATCTLLWYDVDFASVRLC